MENGWLSELLNFIEIHPGWVIALAFALALLESLAVVGLLIPGVVLLFVVGAAIGDDGGLFLLCWAAAAAGGFTGDGVSFWLGRRFSVWVPQIWPLSRRPDLLAASQSLCERRGGLGVFLGRFIGPLRAFVPLVAGSMRLPPRTFVLWAVPACILWAPLYLLPGMLFGASLELAAEFAGRLAVVLLIVVLGLWFAIWLTRVVYGFTARRSGWWLRSIIHWSRRHRILGGLLGPLLEPGGREVLSVALLGLVLLLAMTLLLGLLVWVPFMDTAWDIERQVSGWAASLRNHLADPLFVALTLVGDATVMGWLAGVMTVLLLLLRRSGAAFHWLAATAGAWLLGLALNALLGRLMAGPEFMPTLGEVPHQSFLLVVAVLGFFAVMLAKDLSARHRKWPYLVTTGTMALIGLAQFYLGRATPTGLLTALALGLAWVALVGIAYRQRAATRRHPVLFALTFMVLAMAFSAVEIDRELGYRLQTSRLAQPQRTLSFSEWSTSGWQTLPDRLSRIGRHERSRFDVQVAGDLGALEQALVDRGWIDLTGRAGGWLRELLPSDPDGAVPAHRSKDFAGRPDQLIMRRDGTGSSVVVARFWSSGARLESSGEPIWLGQVRVLQPGRFLGVFARWREVASDQNRALDHLDRSLGDRVDRWHDERPRLYRLGSDSLDSDSTMPSRASSR